MTFARSFLWFLFQKSGYTKSDSQAKIAQRLNISREQVRQLQNRALVHLRRKHPLALRDYLAS